MTKYLTAEEILIIHALIVDEIGGMHGLRDLHLLQSLVERPKTVLRGKDMHATIFAKAAVYLDSLVHYHVFVDGNKRTALAVTARFLEINAHMLTVSNPAAEKFVMNVVQKKLSLKEIAAWLKRNTKARDQ